MESAFYPKNHPLAQPGEEPLVSRSNRALKVAGGLAGLGALGAGAYYGAKSPLGQRVISKAKHAAAGAGDAVGSMAKTGAATVRGALKVAAMPVRAAVGGVRAVGSAAGEVKNVVKNQAVHHGNGNYSHVGAGWFFEKKEPMRYFDELLKKEASQARAKKKKSGMTPLKIAGVAAGTAGLGLVAHQYLKRSGMGARISSFIAQKTSPVVRNTAHAAKAYWDDAQDIYHATRNQAGDMASNLRSKWANRNEPVRQVTPDLVPDFTGNAMRARPFKSVKEYAALEQLVEFDGRPRDNEGRFQGAETQGMDPDSMAAAYRSPAPQGAQQAMDPQPQQNIHIHVGGRSKLGTLGLLGAGAAGGIYGKKAVDKIKQYMSKNISLEALVGLDEKLNCFAQQPQEESGLHRAGRYAAMVGAAGLAGYGGNALLKKYTGKGVSDYATQAFPKAAAKAGKYAGMAADKWNNSAVVNGAKGYADAARAGVARGVKAWDDSKVGGGVNRAASAAGDYVMGAASAVRNAPGAMAQAWKGRGADKGYDEYMRSKVPSEFSAICELNAKLEHVVEFGAGAIVPAGGRSINQMNSAHRGSLANHQLVGGILGGMTGGTVGGLLGGRAGTISGLGTGLASGAIAGRVVGAARAKNRDLRGRINNAQKQQIF